jgi:hypothetical protein
MAGRIDDADTLGHYFAADSISGDNGDLVSFHAGRLDYGFLCVRRAASTGNCG